MKTRRLETRSNRRSAAIYCPRRHRSPRYQGELPEGNDGLGLMLLGVTGDQVLHAMCTADQGRHPLPGPRHGAGRYPEGGPGAEHLHLLHRFCPADDGRRAGIFQRPRTSAISTRSPSPATTSPKPAPTRSPSWPSPWPTASPTSSITSHAGWTSTNSPRTFVLLLQRHGSGILRDRPRGAAHLGQGDEVKVRRRRPRSRS